MELSTGSFRMITVMPLFYIFPMLYMFHRFPFAYFALSKLLNKLENSTTALLWAVSTVSSPTMDLSALYPTMVEMVYHYFLWLILLPSILFWTFLLLFHVSMIMLKLCYLLKSLLFPLPICQKFNKNFYMYMNVWLILDLTISSSLLEMVILVILYTALVLVTSLFAMPAVWERLINAMFLQILHL
jgi:hypothetical protein